MIKKDKFKLLVEAIHGLITHPKTIKLIDNTKKTVKIALGLTAFGFFFHYVDQTTTPIKTDVSYALGTLKKSDGIGIYENLIYRFKDGETRSVELQDVCIKFNHSQFKEGIQDNIRFLTETMKDGNVITKIDTKPLIKKYCKF